MKISQVFTAPNQLTLLRMIFVPFIVNGLVDGHYLLALVLFIVAIPLCFVVIGVPILIGTVIWFLYRTIKGLVRAIENQPYY